MRIDSMDAASKIIEHSAEKSLSVNTAQKTVTAYPNEKTSREDSNALPASEKMIINTIEKAQQGYDSCRAGPWSFQCMKKPKK